MTYEELTQLILDGEDTDIEFKSAKGGLPKSLWETFSAFANTGNGYIVLGVEEHNHSFTIGGVNHPDVMLKQLWDQLHNSQKVSSVLCCEEDVKVIEVNGAKLLLIHVPLAPRQLRPVFINGNPLTGSYKRNYEGDYRCTVDDVRQMLRDASDTPQDYEIIPHFGLKEIDSETIYAYRQRFRTSHGNHPFLNLDDKELLIKIGGYRVDRQRDEEGLTLAGLLMFGKESSIFEALPRFHLDYQEKMSSDPEVRWDYRITQDGTWEANLFNFYFRVYNRLIQDVAVPFALDKEGIRIGETHVHEAIREVLANTLIHANHRGSKSITIIKHKDQFTFTNPGRLRIEIDQLYSGGFSDPRNPYLQKMFQLIGVGEKAGSGFAKILRAWQEQSWLKPLVSERIELDVTIVTMPFLSMVPSDVNHYLGEFLGDKYSSLNELQRLILVIAHQFGSTSNEDISRYTKAHSRDIGAELAKMVVWGWLYATGIGRGMRYSLAEQKPIYISAVGGQLKSLSHKSLSHKSVDNFAVKDVVEQVKNSKRIQQTVLIQAISEVCSNDFHTCEEIANILNRAEKTLRNSFLPMMVKQGMLVLRHPERPNHPQQSYKAVQLCDGK